MGVFNQFCQGGSITNPIRMEEEEGERAKEVALME